jgi:hypothetical protein
MTATSSAKSHRNGSLVQASLEIGRVLAERDGLTFRAAGTCMYPTVRPGDVLRIRPCAIDDVDVGDIAVCRRPTHLFSHRVVARGSDGGRAYIITRPDRVQDKDDDPTHGEDLLGIVAAIERRGAAVPLEAAVHAWPLKAFYALRLKLIENTLRIHLWRQETLSFLQGSTPYSFLARAWLALARPRISYSVRIPQPALGNAVYRRISPEEFDPQTDWRGRRVERWTFVLHINGAREPAAWVAWSRQGPHSWIEGESFAVGHYRGTGLEERLRCQAAEMLHRHGDAIITGRSEPSDPAAIKEETTERIPDGRTRSA